MSSGEVESVTVVRPLKIMAFVCGCLALILAITCIASDYWLEADGFRQGLWRYCFQPSEGADYGCADNDKVFSERQTWITASAALSIISMLFIFGGTVVIGIALISKQSDSRKTMFVGAIGLFAFAVLCMVITMIVFPVMFVEEIQEYRENFGFEKWYFAWSYGIAWGSAIFTFGGAVLLFIDKDNDDILYREKNYYET
ncbi:hypothetical protein CAPTEDRAFT_228269 [Capitella teleta]|uniref:Transmembrane protein 47 n=1 Tax=Capitella teleta TaxID=283909 RepID=R7TFA9_CAPTE|nr:hypothetical protein CAPTEDRAFT_228269 [Capitella teleta]|eukprot:ELT92182.1 hypothetical protein CAPTEDRAFT_228269 [Capitella teleta]